MGFGPALTRRCHPPPSWQPLGKEKCLPLQSPPAHEAPRPRAGCPLQQSLLDSVTPASAGGSLSLLGDTIPIASIGQCGGKQRLGGCTSNHLLVYNISFPRKSLIIWTNYIYTLIIYIISSAVPSLLPSGGSEAVSRCSPKSSFYRELEDARTSSGKVVLSQVPHALASPVLPHPQHLPHLRAWRGTARAPLHRAVPRKRLAPGDFQTTPVTISVARDAATSVSAALGAEQVGNFPPELVRGLSISLSCGLGT